MDICLYSRSGSYIKSVSKRQIFLKLFGTNFLYRKGGIISSKGHKIKIFYLKPKDITVGEISIY